MNTLNHYLQYTGLLLMVLGLLLHLLFHALPGMVLLVSGLFLFLVSVEPEEQQTPFELWQWF